MVLKALAPLLDPAEARLVRTLAAQHHFETAFPHVAGDYAGEHWLASFALLAAQD